MYALSNHKLSVYRVVKMTVAGIRIRYSFIK